MGSTSLDAELTVWDPLSAVRFSFTDERLAQGGISVKFEGERWCVKIIFGLNKLFYDIYKHHCEF